MTRILAADKLADEGLALLRSEPGVELVVRTDWKPGELAAAVREADGVIVRSGVQITAAELAQPGRLRAVARAGVGVDNIDVDAATKSGVLVMNTPDANTLSTAEHALAMMLALSRHVVPACAHVKGGGWQRGKYQGSQLAGKTLGVVGLGRIGRAVALRALSFEMKLLAFDPFYRGATALDDRVRLVGSLGELFAQCDYVTLHAALTDSSRAMINADVLANAKPGLRLINCARGDLIDEAALAEAIKAGKLAGAAVDVYSVEPPPKDHPLFALDQVICTPHLGASTAEAQSAVSVEAAAAMLDYLLRGQVRGAVNVADLPADVTPRERAYADLAGRIGALLCGLCPGGVDAVTVTTHGDSLARMAPALRRYALAALLGPYFENRLNIVNAEQTAREHGIDVRHVARPESHGAMDTIVVAATAGSMAGSTGAPGGASRNVTVGAGSGAAGGTTDDQRHEIEAAIFVDGLPRILRIDGYAMNIEAAGDMVLIFNDDRPGVIGLVGTVFGNRKVNIADMALSRHGGRALMVLRLDGPPPAECLAELQKHDAILSICTARLGASSAGS